MFGRKKAANNNKKSKKTHSWFSRMKAGGKKKEEDEQQQQQQQQQPFKEIEKEALSIECDDDVDLNDLNEVDNRIAEESTKVNKSNKNQENEQKRRDLLLKESVSSNYVPMVCRPKMVTSTSEQISAIKYPIIESRTDPSVNNYSSLFVPKVQHQQQQQQYPQQPSRSAVRGVSRGLVADRMMKFEKKIEENRRHVEEMVFKPNRPQQQLQQQPQQPPSDNDANKDLAATMTNSQSSTKSSSIFSHSPSYASTSTAFGSSPGPGYEQPAPAAAGKVTCKMTMPKRSPLLLSGGLLEEEKDFLIDDEYNDQPALLGITDDDDDDDDEDYYRKRKLDNSRANFFQSMLQDGDIFSSSSSGFPSYGSVMSSNGRLPPRKPRIPQLAHTTPTFTPAAGGGFNRANNARSKGDQPHCNCVDCKARNAYFNQELHSIKKYLMKLRHVLQDEDDARHDDDGGLSDGIASLGSMSSLGEDHHDDPGGGHDLKRRIVLLQQQNEEKDRQIRQLQRQLDSRSPPQKPASSSIPRRISNAATQTERAPRPLSGTAYSASATARNIAEHQNRMRRSRTPLARRVLHCSDADGTLRIPIKPTQL